MSTNLLNYEVDPFDGDEPAYIRVQSVEYGGSYPDITASAAENYPPNASSTGPATRLFIELPYIIDLSDAGDTRPLLVKDITTNTTLTRVTAAPGANEYRVSPITSNRRSIIEVATARAGNQFGYDFYVIGGQLNAADAGKLTGATIKLAIAGQSYNENLADALIGPAADAGAAINTWVNLLNVAGGGTIMLSNGIYIITTPIKMKSNVNLRGEGAGTVLKRNAEIIDIINMDDNSATNCFLSDFKIDGNKANFTNSTNDGIQGHDGSSHFSNIVVENNRANGFRNCYNITNCNGTGNSRFCLESFNISNCYATANGNGFSGRNISNCYAYQNTNTGFEGEKISNCISQENTYGFVGRYITNCLALQNSEDGFQQSKNLNSCSADSNANDGFAICQGMSTCNSEFNGRYGFFNCSGVVGNNSSGNTTADYNTTYANYGGTIAVADTAAGGWNGSV
jgi:hypothetical protein